MKIGINHLKRKTFRIFSLFFLASIFGVQIGYSQISIMPPEAGGISSSVDASIGYYTGKSSVSIPVYTIESGTLKLPISLNYTTGGIKLSDVASWCGLGWSLDFGGVVSRSPQGLVDEDAYEKNKNKTKLIQSFSQQSDNDCSSNSFFCRLITGKDDSQPDDYYYSFPGASGKLVPSSSNGTTYASLPTKNIQAYKTAGSLVDFSDMVSSQQNNMIDSTYLSNGWSFVDGMGNSYAFFGCEKVVTIINSSTLLTTNPTGYMFSNVGINGAINSWWPTQFNDHQGNYIRFYYDTILQHYDNVPSATATGKISGNGPSIFSGNSITFYRQFVKKLRIRKIEFSDGVVEFVVKQKGRADFVGDSALSKILVKNRKGELIKQICLDYDYMIAKENYYESQNQIISYDSVNIPSNAGNTYPNFEVSSTPYSFYYRLFLREIKELDKNGSSIHPGVSVDYSRNIGLRKRDHYGTDHWGYANGYDGVYLETLPGGELNYVSEAKACNLAHGIQGSLKRITFPTGGFSEFLFEQNYGRVIDPTTGVFKAEPEMVGGLRLSQTVSAESDMEEHKVLKNYYYYDGASMAVPYYTYTLPTSYRSEYSQVYSSISPQSVYPMSSTLGGFVGYGRVEEIQVDPVTWNSRGKTAMSFTNPFSNPDSIFNCLDALGTIKKIIPNPAVNHKDWQRGLLLSQIEYRYDSVSQDYLPVKKLENTYSLKILDTILSGRPILTNMHYDSSYSSRTFLYQPNFQEVGYPELESYKETSYDFKGDSVERQTVFQYNPRNMLPSVVTNYESAFSGQEIVNFQSYSADVFLDNANLSITDLPVENIVLRRGPGGYAFISGALNTYDSVSALLVKTSKLILDTPILSFGAFKVAHMPYGTDPTAVNNKGYFQPDARYKEVLSFKRAPISAGAYVLEKRQMGVPVESYIWGYSENRSNYLVASVVGAPSDSLIGVIDQNMLDSAWMFDDAAVRTELNKIREDLPNAFVTTYTYKPLVGITSITNENGDGSFYEYDSSYRLSLVRNHKNEILKRICYNYWGQPDNCSVVYNSEFRDTVYTHDCNSGNTPDPYIYVVPAGRYSALSKTSADSMALQDLAQNAQRYADSLGTCHTTYFNTAINDYFYSSICNTGYTPAPLTVQIAAGVFSSTISQTHAQSLAMDSAFRYADINGVCHSLQTDFYAVNNTSIDITVLLRNTATSEYYFFVVYANTNDELLASLPTGYYDVEIIEYHNNYHTRPWYNWCNNYSVESDYLTYSAYLYSVELSSSCNRIVMY